MKIVRLQGIPKKERESVMSELALLKKLKHPNIVGYEEAFAVKNGTSLIEQLLFIEMSMGK